MKNRDIADLLFRIGTLLEIKGNENIFKIKAYFKAAENILALGEDIEDLCKQKRLREIPGVGQAIEEKICQWIDTGKIKFYEELIKEVPEGLLEIVSIPSVGPKKAKLFFDKLNVTCLADLEKVIAQERFLNLPGVRKKTLQNIIEGVKVFKSGQVRMNLGVASRIAEDFINALKKFPEVKQISAAGSLRRGVETVRDIDILIDSTNPAKIMEAFVNLPLVKTINAQGETKSSILTRDNIQVDLRVVESKSFGAALLYFTGSKNFNIRLRQIAMKKDMKVNEYGVFKMKKDKEVCVASQTEEECLKALDLPYIIPEMREDIGGEALYELKQSPEVLQVEDIRADLHVHSTYSDGRHTIAEMAAAAQKRGYEYLAICDHSAKLKIARGVSIEDLKRKQKEIEALNKNLKNFRILCGTEVEIDSDGNLDYNEATLKSLDFVIGAIHSGFDQSSEQLTTRLIKACQSNLISAIAHPTGVHLGKRDPYSIDLKRVVQAAIDHNVCLEINGFPQRLDLNGANSHFVKSLGAKFIISTDSHSTEHLKYMSFGVTVARRGWLTKADVLNTLPLKDFLKAIKRNH